MSQLRMSLDCLLKKIGVAHSAPDGCDETLYSWIYKSLNVEKVSDISFQNLNEISASLDCIVTTSDTQQIYNIILDYEKSFAK